MPRWVPCDQNFIVGDVIRWKEPIWKPFTRRKRVIGERELIGQVLAEQKDGFVTISIRKCLTKRAEDWARSVPELKTGAEIRRHRAPFGKRTVERYLWGGVDGESARGILTSKFLQATKDYHS